MSNSASIIDPKIKMIVETVLERCKKEKDHGALQVPIENFITRVSYYTALPAGLVSSLFESGIGTAQLADKVSMPTVIEITKTLLKFYAAGQYPTVTEVYYNIEDTFIRSLTYDQFASLLFLLGYHYKATIPQEKLLLMEKPAFTFERTHFLKKIQKLRDASANIVYLGERVINSRSISKLWPDYKEKIMSTGIINDEFILYHIASKTGLKHYLFTNCISSADFNKWLSDIVLPTLEFNTTIVLENNPLHSNVNEKQPTEYHSKAAMLAYLKQNNIPCSQSLSKAELFNLIQLCVKTKPFIPLDRLLHAYGHSFLFLPYKCQSLSMIELLWEHVNKNCEIKNDMTIIHVKGYIEDILINKISSELWNEFYDSVSNYETCLQELDIKIEETLEIKYKFQTSAPDKDEEFEFSI